MNFLLAAGMILREGYRIRQSISDHIEAIKHIKEILKRKSETVWRFYILVGIMVSYLLISLPMGLYYSSPTLIEFFSKIGP